MLRGTVRFRMFVSTLVGLCIQPWAALAPDNLVALLCCRCCTAALLECQALATEWSAYVATAPQAHSVLLRDGPQCALSATRLAPT